MSTPTAAPPRPSTTFTSLVAVGVLVVAAGLILPRLLSLSPAPPSADAEPAAPLPPPSAAPVTPSDDAEPASLTWVLAKLMFGLAIVAGVCIGVARWSNRTNPTATTGVLTPLAKLAVDPRCVVHLVGAGGRRLLIGIDAAGAKVVLELPPK